ncbi:phage late control D family protein, partial [Escherichia coli ATCC 700728]
MSTGLRFTLEVDGLPPDAFAVVSFHLTQSLSSLFSLDLSLVSQQFLSLEFAQVLDKMAYLTIWQGDDVQRRVKGVVTWFELGENDKNQMLYSMKVPAAVACRSAPELPYLPERGHQKHPRHDIAGKRGDR